MKQIFYRIFVLLALIVTSSCALLEKVELEDQRVLRITQPNFRDNLDSIFWTLPQMESLGVETISSLYFDKAMHAEGSRFAAIPFSRLIKNFLFKSRVDSVLLNCWDDYQAILTINEIQQYDLRLATRLNLSFQKPDWLKPFLILVPDGKHPPFKEKFMTANIRELKFVRMNDYYSYLNNLSMHSEEVSKGVNVFKENCLFCHSLKRVGGNKGPQLLLSYNFSESSEEKRFLINFSKFHHTKNQEKQLVSFEELKFIVRLLLKAQKGEESIKKSSFESLYDHKS